MFKVIFNASVIMLHDGVWELELGNGNRMLSHSAFKFRLKPVHSKEISLSVVYYNNASFSRLIQSDGGMSPGFSATKFS